MWRTLYLLINIIYFFFLCATANQKSNKWLILSTSQVRFGCIAFIHIIVEQSNVASTHFTFIIRSYNGMIIANATYTR